MCAKKGLSFPQLSAIIASCGGLGYSRYAPGTVGSLAGMLCVLALRCFFSVTCLVWVGCALTAAGWWATRQCLISPDDDPSWIVIDEWCAMWFLTLVVPRTLPALFAAFLLFRLLDIAKPWPVSLGERVPGASGVFLDDFIAALLAGIFLFCLVIPGIL